MDALHGLNMVMDELIIVALGSNLNNGFSSRLALLEAALVALNAAKLRVVERSSWWRSKSWPTETDPDYLNGIVFVETALDPGAVLTALLGVEGNFGRRRADANAPRTLDLDLIAYGRRIIRRPGLVVPHPRAAERLFVMGPLAEIAPAWRHPVNGETAEHLAAGATIGADAALIVGH